MAKKIILGFGATQSAARPATARSGRAVERLRRWLVQAGALLTLLLLAGYLTLATPYFLTTSNIANVARQTAMTAILATGQTFVILSAGIDLSVAAVAGLSASVATVLMTSRVEVLGVGIGPVPFGVGLGIALLVGMVAGLLNGLIITKGRIPDFIATLGMLATLRGVALLVTGGLPVPSHLTAIELKGYLPEPLIWMGAGEILGIPVAGIIALGVVILSWLILRYTALGRAVFAVGGNREAARVSGINIDRTKIAVYMLSGFFAALAGMIMTGRLNSANALMGEGEELRSIAATVIGGTNLFGGEGSVIGTLIGALIIGVLGNGLNLLNVSAFWQRVVQGLVIIVAVILDQWRRRRLGA